MQLCSIQAGMDEPSLSSIVLRKQLWSSKTYQPKVWPRILLFYHRLLPFSPKTEAHRQVLSPAWDAESLQMGRVRDEEKEHFPDPPEPRENLLNCCTPATPLNNFIHQLQVKLQRGCQHWFRGLWGISTWFYFLLAAYFWLNQQIQSLLLHIVLNLTFIFAHGKRNCSSFWLTPQKCLLLRQEFESWLELICKRV